MTNRKIFCLHLAATLAAYVASVCVLGAFSTLLLTGYDSYVTMTNIATFVLVLALFFTLPTIAFNWFDVDCWKSSVMVATFVCLGMLALIAQMTNGDWSFVNFLMAFGLLMVPGLATAFAATFGFAWLLRALKS